MIFLIICCHLGARNKIGAHFKKEIDGKKNDRQSEGVASGSDDCGQHKQYYNGMAAVSPEETTVQYTQYTQQPSQQRQFKDNAHDKNEHQEGVHVAVERNLVGDQLAHMVVGS